MNDNGRHRLDVGYLVVGLVFLGMAATGWLLQLDLVRLPELRWLLPATLVAAGVVGLAAIAVRNRTPDPTPEHDREGDL